VIQVDGAVGDRKGPDGASISKGGLARENNDEDKLQQVLVLGLISCI